MKKLSILILFFLCDFLSEASALSYKKIASCHDLTPKPKIILKTSYGKLVHDFNLSSELLEAKGYNIEKQEFSEGLATQAVFRTIELKKYSEKKLNETTTCILPEEIEFTIGYKNPEIYVSKDLDFQSCRFSMMIRHEQYHQQINKLVLDHYLQILFDELEAAVRDVKPVQVSAPENVEADTQKLVNYYHKRLNPVFNIYLEILRNEHNKLDNLTNYKVEMSLCKKFGE